VTKTHNVTKEELGIATYSNYIRLKLEIILSDISFSMVDPGSSVELFQSAKYELLCAKRYIFIAPISPGAYIVL
jgi:hypothetical protein